MHLVIHWFIFHSYVCLFFSRFRCQRRIFGQSSSSPIISTETGSTPDQRQATCSLNAQRRMNMVRRLITQKSWLVLKTVNKLCHYCTDTISFPEPTCLLISAKTQSSGIIHFKSPRFWDFRFHGACVPWLKTWCIEIKSMWMRIECLCGTNPHQFYLWTPF